MKRAKFLACLSLVAVLGLAGCTGGGESSSSSSSSSTSDTSSSSSSEDPIPTEWTDAQKALMKEHLFDTVLPYVTIKGTTLEWDATKNVIVINAPAIKTAEVSEYCAGFESAGFIGGLVQGATAGNYDFAKAIDFENGFNEIKVNMSIKDAYGRYATSGSLEIVASTGTYYTNWTDAQKELMAEYLYGVVLPYVSAEGTEVADDGYGGIEIKAPSVSIDEVTNYICLLEDAGFVGSGDESYYMCEKAVSTEDGTRYISVSVQLKVENEDDDFGSLTISANDPYYYSFAEVFESALEYGDYFFNIPLPVDFDIPAVDADHYELDTLYLIFGFDAIGIICYGEDMGEAAMADYADGLDELGWEVEYVADEEYGDSYVCTAAEGDCQVDICVYGEGSIEILIMPLLKKGPFPTEDINAFLADYLDVTDVEIPALEGDQFSFYPYYDEDYGYYYGVLEAFDEGTIGVDSYEDKFVTALEAAGWEIDDSEYEEWGYFAYSAHGEVLLQFYSYEDDYGDGAFICYIDFGDGEDHTPDLTNYGSKEAPLTLEEVKAITDVQCAADKDTTKKVVTTSGTVKSIGEYVEKNNYYKNVVITDGTNDLLLYTINVDASVGNITLGVGDEITVTGYIKNYSGTIEMCTANNTYANIVAYKKADLAITGISLDKTTASVVAGKTVQLNASIAPAGAEGTVEWTSSDETVATVVDGLVTVKADATTGATATITAKVEEFTATCVITVIDPIAVSGIALDKTEVSVEAGKSTTLVATLSPEGAEGEITWTSSNEDVATVADGVVTVKADATAGATTTITASCAGFEATCVVTVKETASQVTDTILAGTLVGDAKATVYTTFENVSAGSDAKYSGIAAKSNAGGIQINSKNSYGITTSVSGGTAVSISIAFDKTNTNTVNVFASNTAFTTADMLSGSMTPVATLNNETTSYTFTNDYAYVGICSAKGAIYMTSISITWAK